MRVRRRGRTVVIISLVCACALANLAVVGGAPARASAPASVDAPRLNAAAGSYGTVVGLSPRPGACGDPDPNVVASRMAELAALGVTIMRCDLNWWSVQPTATSWLWGAYDNVVTEAAKAGIRVLFVPEFTPPWAQPKPLPAGTTNGSHVPPVHTSDYVTFVQHAVNRWSPIGHARPAGFVGSVRFWEIWNEPNIPGFWNPVDPVGYTTFFKATATAIHAIDAAATVITGGLAPAANVNGQVAPDTFVYVMAILGGLKPANAVGIHPYTFPAWPYENVPWNPIVNIVPKMYAIMARFGEGAKKIWATEIGWPTSSRSDQVVRPDGTDVGTEYYQAVMLPLTITAWFQHAYAGPLILYEQQDKCQNLTSWWCMMGILRVDGTKKPAYATVKAWLTLPIGS